MAWEGLRYLKPVCPSPLVGVCVLPLPVTPCSPAYRTTCAWSLAFCYFTPISWFTVLPLLTFFLFFSPWRISLRLWKFQLRITSFIKFVLDPICGIKGSLCVCSSHKCLGRSILPPYQSLLIALNNLFCECSSATVLGICLFSSDQVINSSWAGAVASSCLYLQVFA